MPKYPNHNQAILSNDLYFSIMEKKGLKFLKIKRTKTFEKVQGLELEIQTEHVWTKTDTLISLSRKFYGSNDYWWVLGMVNKKPTDAHYSIGDILYVPEDPVSVLEAIR